MFSVIRSDVEFFSKDDPEKVMSQNIVDAVCKLLSYFLPRRKAIYPNFSFDFDVS